MIARFRRGRKTLNLVYPMMLGADFIPPMVSEMYTIGTGSAMNTLTGGELIDVQAQNRMMEFSVNVFGANAFETEMNTGELVAFLAGHREDTTYFEFSSSDMPEPLWGTLGAVKRYEIVTALASLSQEYNETDEGYPVHVSLTVKPLATGSFQRLAQALGGVIEDDLGIASGRARGLRIAPYNENKMTHPVDYYSASWTAGANIVRQSFEDKRFVMPGRSYSYKLTAIAGSANTHTQSINAGNTNAHVFTALVMRDDLAAVTSADCQIYYNAALATTFTNLGSGLYLAEATASGINSATATGLVIASGRTVIQLYFGMREGTVRVPVSYGAMLGHSWTGTAFASTSVCAAGRVRVPVDASTFNLGSGAIAVTWKSDFISTAAGDRFLFSFGSTSIRAYYLAADDKFYFTDHTNTISTAAQTFAAEDIIRLVFVWGPSGLTIYKNGVSAATGATYTPPALPSYCYIGTDHAAANPAGGVVCGFTIYGTEPTTAQIAAIDAASNSLSAAGMRVDWIPYLWTKDGDDVVDNANDDDLDNFGVVGSVPGNVAADTIIDADLATDFQYAQNLWLFHDYQPYFVNPSVYDCYTLGGTDTADANSEGGEYSLFAGTGTYYTTISEYVTPERYVVMTRVRSSAGTLVSTISISTAVSTLTLDASTSAFGLLYAGEFSTIPDFDRIIDADPAYSRSRYATTILLNNGTTTAGSLYVDYVKTLPRPAVRVYSAAGANQKVVINGDILLTDAATSLKLSPGYELSGDIIEFRPGGLNNLIALWGTKGLADFDDTCTFSIRICPRYKLL